MKNKETDVTKTADALKIYLAENQGASQGTIAKAIGVSSASISQFLSGKYPGDQAKLAEKIGEFLGFEAERKQYEQFEQVFVPTSQAQAAIMIINYCHIHRVMGVIHAPAGVGKTMAIQRYADQNSWVRVISCYAGISLRDLLEEILDTLGEAPRGSWNRMLKTIIGELKGSSGVLVIDEAQHLTLKGFEILRTMHDRTRIPIVFSGTDDVIDRMTGRKNMVYDQIFSRVNIRRRLKTKIKKADVALLIDAAGIDTKERRDVLDYLYPIAQRRGYYRTMMHCLLFAQRIAKQQGEELTINGLQAAARILWDQPVELAS